MRTQIKKGGLVVITTALIILGAFFSLDVAFRRTLDPDMFHSVLVWQGIEQYGWQWVNEWRFTQDNWIFSLVPFQVVLFKFTGAPVFATVFSGWLIFFLAAVTSALIAHQLGGRYAPWVVFTLLIWSNAYAHLEGFVSYPVSHNITNLFGLITIWLGLRWVSAPSTGLLGLIVLLQLVAGFSDPWLLPTFTLPMILTGLILCFRRNASTDISRKDWLVFVGLLILAFVLIKTRCFGLMTFMPVMHFAPGNWATMANNVYYLIRNIGGLYSLIYPIWSPEPWPETLLSYTVCSALLIVGFFSFCACKVILRGAAMQDSFFYWVAAFSVAGIGSAYIISNVEGSLISSRFVVNAFYFILVGIAVWTEKNWTQLSRLFKYAVVIGAALYLSSGLVSFVRYSSNNWYLSSETETRKLIDFLDKNDLDYGYGPYHGARTAVVSVLTEDRIKIRPVSFDPATGRMLFIHPQTAPRWYTEADVNKGQTRYFVYLPRRSFECPDYDKCYQALVNDYGPPVAEIKLDAGAWEEGVAIVWDHPLVNWASTRPLEVVIGQPIRLDNTRTMPAWPGWAGAEPWGVWSDGPRAMMQFQFDQPIQRDLQVELIAQAYAPMIGANQRVEVTANGQAVAQLYFTPQHNQGVRQIIVPKGLVGSDRWLALEFFIDNPRSPKERNLSPDTRQLGIGLTEIKFIPAAQ